MKKYLFLLLIIPMIVFPGCITTTSDGEHTGYITAAEKNGFIWKTGKIYIKTDLSSSQEDSYCVTDDNIYKKLQDAARNKEKLTIQFHSEAIVAPWRCGEENAIIDSIKFN